MATLEERFEWLKETLLTGETNFEEIIKDDIAVYLDIDKISISELETLLNKKFNLFQSCETQADVELFISHIVSHIIMNSQNEELIADYLATASKHTLRMM